MIKYSFIIPVKEINDYIRESVPKILQIKRSDFEIIIYPDAINNEVWEKTKQIASGPGGPAMKRTLATRDAQGEILVFIDDDAYPQSDFLDILDNAFLDDTIAAVGGPAITPADDSFGQKVSGAVFLSKFSGGCPERYVPVGAARYVDDWPSVNLSVRKKDFDTVGGFNSAYWPGEDTLFCLALIKTGKKILYKPQLIAYHHRREGLLRHLKQVRGYGLHRGFFAKKFPETSFKLKYFVPSLFLIFVVVGFVAVCVDWRLASLYVGGWLLYLAMLIGVFFEINEFIKNRKISAHALYYILLTHLSYGWSFLNGFLFTKELKSKLR